MRVLFAVTCLALCPTVATAQQSASRAADIIAAFTKQKHVVATHRGVQREKYKDVRAEPVINANIGEYAGRYEVSGLDRWLELRVTADGRIQGTGADGGRTFELSDARIERGMLTATKVYRDGVSERLEGLFLNRIERTSPTDPGTRAFGLGVLLDTPVHGAGGTFNKLFYQKD